MFFGSVPVPVPLKNDGWVAGYVIIGQLSHLEHRNDYAGSRLHVGESRIRDANPAHLRSILIPITYKSLQVPYSFGHCLGPWIVCWGWTLSVTGGRNSSRISYYRS